MSNAINPAAAHHLPVFITAPGETDILFIVTGCILIIGIVTIGVLYFRLHALPEHIAHGSTKIQYEIVAVLALISLFTHNHVYWIAGLLLALVQLPDFTTPLVGIAESLATMARGRRRPPDIDMLPPPAPHSSLRDDTAGK